jgi:hypothetical protein
MYKSVALMLFVGFLTVAFVGALWTAPPPAAEIGCPLEMGCSIIAIDHLDHWQATFAATLADVVVLLALTGILVGVRRGVDDLLVVMRWRQREHAPLPPPVLQELFSQGILHRKVP